MELKVFPTPLSVCQVESIPQELLQNELVFVGRTDEELSLVCPTAVVPANPIARDDGWQAFRIQGVLDFSLVGILAPIATLLAENRIGIFAVSTYNTDYVLIKAENMDKALTVLEEAGYIIVR